MHKEKLFKILISITSSKIIKTDEKVPFLDNYISLQLL